MEWAQHSEKCLTTNIEARADAFTYDDIRVAYKGTALPDAIIATGPLVTARQWAMKMGAEELNAVWNAA